MQSTPNIKSISYLKSHAAQICEELVRNGAPFFITQNGEASMVIEGVQQFHEKQALIAALKITSLGEKDRAQGLGITAEQSRAQLLAARTGPHLMAVVVLPDAQADLLQLQDYMLHQWGEAAWLKAEDEIFNKLGQVDCGLFNGTPVLELASVGINEYRHAITSHHKLLYRKHGSDTYVYLIAGHQQDYPTLLEKRLLRR